MYEIKVIRRMWNLYKILCAPLFRMGRSLALLQRICKASNSGYASEAGIFTFSSYVAVLT